MCSALESLVPRGCKSLTSLPSGPEAQEYSCLRRLAIRECPSIKSLPSALQQRLDSGLMEATDLDSRLEGTHQSFPYGACINPVFACMPLSIFCLVDTPPYIHVCPVISNLNAYYVYVLILTEAADICIFEILLDFDDSLTSIYRSCVLHGCLGISTSLLLAFIL